jgi:excisionase family DNA binding protein
MNVNIVYLKGEDRIVSSLERSMRLEDMMTLAEAARELGLPYQTVYTAWAAGRIPHERVKSLILVRVDDVRETFAEYKPRAVAQPKVRA